MTEPRSLPKVVSREEWRAAREALLAKEKAHTRAGDALNAERRRLPMVKIEKKYVFEGPQSKATLVDLFDGRHQLVLYHFMFGPNQTEGCDGCSLVVDNMGHPAHLHARDITRVLVSRAPLERIEPFKKRMGWTMPWYSSYGSDFNHDFGVGPESPQAGVYQDGEMFGMSVFLRDGDEVYHTYFTDQRGVEHIGSSFSYLDITPYGRQEDWEVSPEGWPKGPRYSWWRHHDRYEAAQAPSSAQQRRRK
ncbi:MAG: DUF899 domain-containing protein [Luteitalea sp.]|nr:DUF899 domain-containing protein [Luteitalea sp.]